MSKMQILFVYLELLLLLVHDADVEVNVVILVWESQRQFVTVESVVDHVLLLEYLAHDVMAFSIIWIELDGLQGELLANFDVAVLEVNVGELELQVQVVGVDLVGGFQVVQSLVSHVVPNVDESDLHERREVLRIVLEYLLVDLDHLVELPPHFIQMRELQVAIDVLRLDGRCCFVLVDGGIEVLVERTGQLISVENVYLSFQEGRVLLLDRD